VLINNVGKKIKPMFRLCIDGVTNIKMVESDSVFITKVVMIE
jgi:hypothetical protein